MDTDPLSLLSEHETLAGQIAHVRVLEPRGARYGELSSTLHPRLAETLRRTGRERLYSHQAIAVDAAQRGEDVVVATGTNSGKTLCYNIPAIQRCLTEPAARALYLFPTKALAQDQLGKLEELCPPDVRCATYDGDTPTSRRASIRKAAHIVLTNPDMLHVGILPGNESWVRFLKALRVIVIDEMHTYRGVFGSHVGCVLRRLLRLCAWHRSQPQIIACSATIGNPTELFGRLTGRQPLLVDEDGSPQAKRTFVFWNPPAIDELSRASPNVATAQLLSTFVQGGLSTLAFCRARISVELVLKYARKSLSKAGVATESVESYRAGYTPKERRAIEKALFSGTLKGLAATSAMELGVDVGGLDAVILNGYPGTVSSFWQQAGRAGRGTREGLAVYVAHDDPLEQFLIRDPHLILESPIESVSADPENPQILAQQIRCAAYERPLAPGEASWFGHKGLSIAESLEDSGDLSYRAGLFFYPSHEPPAPKVDIRSGGPDGVVLIRDGEELGTMERWRAMQNAHEGAVYLHRGATYVVERLDLGSGEAHVSKREVDYYTQPMVQSLIESLLRLESGPSDAPEGQGRGSWGAHSAGLGSLRVTDVVTAFRRKSLEGGQILGVEELDMPPLTFETIGIQIDFPELLDQAEIAFYAAAVHGLEHALMAVAPLLAGCDRGDLGSGWYAIYPGTLAPALFVFDRTPGGVGLVESLWRDRGAWVLAARQLLRSCPCAEGCPSCLLSARCESSNEALDKSGALRLLGELHR